MLQACGAYITVDGDTITVTNQNTLQATNIHVPGDISSAAFWLVAAAIVPNSNITLKHVGLNQTRTGIIDVLDKMGANITITNEQVRSEERRVGKECRRRERRYGEVQREGRGEQEQS